MTDSPAPENDAPTKVQRTWPEAIWDFIIGRDPNRKPPETLGLMFKENAEAFLFAIVLVIIVRHFSLTPFRIPSASMEPTLLGNDQINDRLFVNRWAYEVGEPRRWDVVVFLYPLNEDKHFIKRLVGLPEEELFVADGDIYVRPKGAKEAHIARKTDEVQDAMWIPLGEMAYARDHHWETDAGFTYIPRGKFTLAGTADPTGTWVRYANPTAGYLRLGSPDLVGGSKYIVGDVRVTVDVDVLPQGATALAQIKSGEEVFELALPAGGKGTLTHRSKELKTTLVIPLEHATPGGSFTLSFAHVDRQAVVIIDGTRWVLHDYDALREKHGLEGPITPLETRAPLEKSSVAVGARGGTVELSDMLVHRDVHYVNQGLMKKKDVGYQIPAERHFMMGDNSPNSSDSRQWTVRKVIVEDKKTGEQREIIGETGGSSRGQTKRLRSRDGAVWEYLDNKGRWQRVDTRKEKILRDNLLFGHAQGNALPEFVTVHRDQIIGRAFLIFWPPRRLGFIR